MSKLNRSCCRALPLVLLAVSGSVAAEQASTRFTVSAVVPQQVSVQAVDQPARLAVTSEDVLRGYKDVSARYEVRHNIADGYLLSLSPRLGVATRVEVLGLDGAIELRDHGVEIHRRRPGGLERLGLTFRFVLDAAARPGSYALPIHLSASPLR
jgi:hypothetical protein